MSIGYALSGSSPSPAVRLVPAKRMEPRVLTRAGAPAATVDSGDADAAGESDARGFSLDLEHATRTTVSIPTANRRFPPPIVSRFPLCMLVARDLSKEYRSGENPLTVLRDVNFSIPQGAFVSIVGPSGSGKTTLLGLLAGLDTPSRGQVILDGADLT